MGERQHRVLFLSSYSQSHFPVPDQWKGIYSACKDNGVMLDTEYMDTKNHPEKENIEKFRDLLAYKMQNTQYDVVITGDDAALVFFDENRDTLFKDIPAVYLGIDNIDYAEKVHQQGWATGVLSKGYYLSVYKEAAKLFPQYDTFVTFVDDTSTGQADAFEVKKLEKDFPGYQFDIICTSDYTKSELKKKAAAINDHSIIFELSAYYDAEGNIYSIDDMCRLISSQSYQPLFRATTGGVGSGALGGGFVDAEKLGVQAAEMAFQIINGTSPSEIQPLLPDEMTYVFDQDKMNEYHISRKDLPENSTRINARDDLFDQYQDILKPAAFIFTSFLLVLANLFIGMVQTGNDAKRLRKSEKKLRHELYFDSLTGLMNRNGLFALDTSSYRSACVLNIDDFKFINDKYGNLCGDEVLKTLARRIESIPETMAVRLGSDEFFLLFKKDISLDPALISRLDALIHTAYTYENYQPDVSLSMGFAVRKENETASELLAHAEIAMFQGRSIHQRHGLHFFDEQMRQELDQKSKVVDDLTKAIRQKNFYVLYQPQVCTKTKDIYGFEALCRYKDNQYYPDQFIPAAEESGLIIQLDRIVTEMVVTQMGRWKKEGRKLPVVSINYSARQLKDPGYCTFLQELLKKYEIPEDRIKIEITERSVFSDKERSTEFFHNIHAMGMDLALDDYGTGYSSITSMTQLPVDFIKFDKSLIDTYLVPGKSDFIANLTALVHESGKQIVAEGVETKEQYDLAVTIGIDQIQGYYFDKPLPADQAMEADYASR